MAIKAMLYEEVKNPDGTLTMKPLTNMQTLSVSVVAKVLDVSRFTVYRLIENGALPAELPSPRSIRIRADSLERYRHEHAQQI